MLRPLSKVAIASAILSMLKLSVFLFSGSMVVLVSFFDSLVDTCMSWLNSKVQNLSQEEADVEHPYGHGGFEVFAAAIQGALLSIFAAFIFLEIFQDLAKLLLEGQGPILERQGYFWGFSVLIIGAFSGFLFQYYLGMVQKKKEFSHSLSIESDRAHYLSDFAMNLASALGLGLSWWWQNPWIDRAFAVIGALFLLYTGLPILWKSFKHISQESLSPQLKREIVEKIMGVDARVLGVHRLRTRRAGPDMFADFHLKLPDQIPLNMAHEISYKVADYLRSSFNRLDVVIHLDPASEPDDDLWQDHSYKHSRTRL